MSEDDILKFRSACDDLIAAVRSQREKDSKRLDWALAKINGRHQEGKKLDRATVDGLMELEEMGVMLL